MNTELWILISTAATFGFIHTVIGPDHYLPFIVMAKAQGWKTKKTVWVTILAGIGHILSSVILGVVGLALGYAATAFSGVESLRGEIAAWGLIVFGLVYFAWGIRDAARNKPHTHLHVHADHGADLHRHEHDHEHTHHESHLHAHAKDGRKVNITPWVIFTIFVFGPCEPLIPIVMYPAAKHNMLGVALVTAVFGFVTIATMLTFVLVSVKGISFLPVHKFDRYTNALAGFTILLCGVGINFLGL